MARGAGFGWAESVEGDAAAGARLDELFAQRGPALLDVTLQDEPCPALPPGPWSQVEERTLFMRAVQALEPPVNPSA